MTHSILQRMLTIIGMITIFMPSQPFAQTHAAPLPCEDKNWPLATRTLPDICPEILIDGYAAEGALSSFGALGFDAADNLYITRPATGEVLFLAEQAGRYAAPQAYPRATLPFYRMLWTFGLIERDKRLFSGSAWSPEGVVWYVDAANTIRSARGDVIDLEGQASPTGIAFYRGAGFPRYQGGLLVVTGGSWNATTIAGYELLWVPFKAGKPGQPTKIVPANVADRTTADSALAYYSFYPERPVAVAVDSRGWIYVATHNGRLMRFRPRTSA